MDTTLNISVYHKKVIDLVLETHDDIFSAANPGHCMKIAGFGDGELEYMWDVLTAKYSTLDVFIVSDQKVGNKYISATKLIELRNKQEKALLVLIPSASRTAAEDSYGNATFKEITLEGIEEKLEKQLLNSISDPFNKEVTNVLNYIKDQEISLFNKINYLISLTENGVTPQNVGNYIFHLNLIPDEFLLQDREKMRSRINFNLKSIELLASFNKPLYDRISGLPLKSNSIQKAIVDFVKGETEARSAEVICKIIFDKYPELNFSKWPIPDLDVKDVKLFTEDIRSNDFKIEEGRKVLRVETGKSSKIKVRFSTKPIPKDIEELYYFNIVLMAVDGGSGDEIRTLRKLKNTNIARPYREAIVELNPNVIEEGSYFLKVRAEDEHGNTLNANDDFKEENIQRIYEEELVKNKDFPKSSLKYKLTCDSEDFDYLIDDEVEKNEEQRKDKLDTVLQAYFKFRIEQFRKEEEASTPVASETSNIWLNDDKERHTSTFYINYSQKHNYQISLSSKLRFIEDQFLNNASQFGYVYATLQNNYTAYGFENIKFVQSEITSIVPDEILKLRSEIFNRIKESNKAKNGVFETADIFNVIDVIRTYIEKLTDWTKKLKEQISSKESSLSEKEKLQHFLTEMQMLDCVRIKTRLPDGKPANAILLSPLHPLRLAWHVQLFDVFTNWENKTREYAGHKDEWTVSLEKIFDGFISPENNPLVIVEPGTSFKSYYYSGELSFGWGIYLSSSIEKNNETLTSITRQLKQYYRTLLNISKDNYVETDISQKLVVRHLKNYLIQHPYTEKLIINLINGGDSSTFADAFVELEQEEAFKKINYEVRIFKGEDKIIEHGAALKNLINPDFNVSEEAEAFSQPSRNRLFPKLRFSINSISEYLSSPGKYSAHISFLISPFPIQIELLKPHINNSNFFLNGLLVDASVVMEDGGNDVKWNRFILPNQLSLEYSKFGNIGVELFKNIQTFIAGALASKYTDSIPATQLILNDKDKVLLTHLHDYSDWVVTFDKNLGAQIFDQPSLDGRIPFLLDYVPGEEISGISSFLTTRPTSEILGLLGPHFEEFGIDIHNPNDQKKIQILLEDLRAVSSSLVLQLNSTKNKAFEVIGSAFTKRVLEKKGFLKNAFLIPIDLHQNLFENLTSQSKSRADDLLVSIDIEKRKISIAVIEIKCRTSLGENDKEVLKSTMKDQIENTIEALRMHFDPSYYMSYDRLDREIKNKELRSLLTFYLDRANRYTYLSDNAHIAYSSFIQTLDKGFSLEFKQLGLIFDFSSNKRHQKEVIDSELTFFTFGRKLIDDILDPDSDLNTKRLEDELDTEISLAIGTKKVLAPIIKELGLTKVDSSSAEIINLPVKEKSTKEYTLPVKEFPPLKVAAPKEEIVQENKEVAVVNLAHLNFDILVGKSSVSEQLGLLGKSMQGKKIAIDLSDTNTICLFGVQGGGKSYTIGTVTEMVLKQFNNVNTLPSPLAGVIFHYSESSDYKPEFTSMIYPNDKETELKKLKDEYGADPSSIEDVIILTPKDKIEDRKLEYPSITVLPISFNSKELTVQDWMFLLGAIGNDSAYIKQLKAIMKEHRKNITLEGISNSVEDSTLLSNSQKALARQKLNFAREYIDDTLVLRDVVKPGRLVIVDLRDEFIEKDEALGLFVIMLNIFSSVSEYNGTHFNKFIVFDEAHKYMDNKDLTGNIVTAIREMRHKGVSIMIASQDPPSLPNEIIELSSIVLLHKFNSPLWLKHIQKSITQLNNLSASDMSALKPGEGFLWATKATDNSISTKPLKISTRPRVTKHGGSTIQATGKK